MHHMPFILIWWGVPVLILIVVLVFGPGTAAPDFDRDDRRRPIDPNHRSDRSQQ